MPGEEYFNSDAYIDGKLKITTLPNSQGSVVLYNPTTKELSQRTNNEIISDLGLATQTWVNNNFATNANLSNYHKFNTNLLTTDTNNIIANTSNELYYYGLANSPYPYSQDVVGSISNFGGKNFGFDIASFNVGNSTKELYYRSYGGGSGVSNWSKLYTSDNFNTLDFVTIAGPQTIIGDKRFAVQPVSSDEGFQTTVYKVGQRNRIWSFGNADSWGISYYKSTYHLYGEGISFHFGDVGNPKVFLKDDGQLYTKQTIKVISPDSTPSNNSGLIGVNYKLILGVDTWNSGNATYGTAFWVEGSGHGYIQQQRFDGNQAVYNLNLQPLGGDVTINMKKIATQEWVNTNFIPKSHPVYNITQAWINNWNTIANEGIRLNYAFTSTTNNNIAITDNKIGMESGLTDLSNNKVISGVRGNFYKYGSTYNNYEGINISKDSSVIGIGSTNSAGDKVEVYGDISVNVDQDNQLILNPLVTTNPNVSDVRNAHVYISTSSNVTLPNYPISGQRFEIYNSSNTTTIYVIMHTGVTFPIPPMQVSKGVYINGGYNFMESTPNYKRY